MNTLEMRIYFKRFQDRTEAVFIRMYLAAQFNGELTKFWEMMKYFDADQD